ncbi:MAG: sigma-54-dependent Fis family transcriptional regulator [Deltaproteobacteria bacterium]|nr:sigma-54-dependent Fis family transcriptional regulator [Deltaproteobacteria bacterium]
MRSILVLSKREQTYEEIKSAFQSICRVDYVSGDAEAIEIIKKRQHDYLFVDLDTLKVISANGNGGYKAAFKPFWTACQDIEIIVIAPSGKIREAVMAVKAGASNYLTYPLDPVEQRYITESLDQSKIMQSELDYLRDKFWDKDARDVVHTRSPLMKKIFEEVQSVAPTRSTVLITGETGTGKGVLAKLIHKHSDRRYTQFISVHCGAIPDNLLESELFGHEKGAFTGAVRRQLGKFEIANGGTIFLDEIGTITHMAQIKLLQVLQEGTFQRVGGETTIKADVRVIAATNDNLKEMSDAGAFRKDLYYRLNVFPIEIIPLRERREDIPLLVEAFIEKLNKSYSKEIYDIHPRVMDAFMTYDWPGNIRELENLLERAYIIENTSVLAVGSFPGDIFTSLHEHRELAIDVSATLSESRRQYIDQFEFNYLQDQLKLHAGSISGAAKAAGITTRQLHKLMKKYDLHKERFKKRT